MCVCVSWLYKEATVRDAQPCPTDQEHLVVDVVISRAAYHRFRKTFTQLSSKGQATQE